MVEAVLDGGRIDTREALHDALARSLDLPPYYGRNLDALFDCLTDLQEDVDLRIDNFRDMRAALGCYAEALWSVLDQASRENGHFTFSVRD